MTLVRSLVGQKMESVAFKVASEISYMVTGMFEVSIRDDNFKNSTEFLLHSSLDQLKNKIFCRKSRKITLAVTPGDFSLSSNSGLVLNSFKTVSMTANIDPLQHFPPPVCPLTQEDPSGRRDSPSFRSSPCRRSVLFPRQNFYAIMRQNTEFEAECSSSGYPGRGLK